MRLAILLICALLAPVSAAAQEAWLQIAAERNIDRARAVAEQFSGALPGISLIELGSSWIAVAAGPLPEAQAAALLRDLRATGAIPRDSYLSDGARFGEVLWRAGTALPPPPDGSGTAQPAETQPGAAPVDAARLREAQRALAFQALYAGPLDGQVTDETRAAIARWQAAAGYGETGSLDDAQLATLLAPMQAAEAPMGFETVQDDVTGITIDIPSALVAFDRHDAPYAHYAPRAESGVSLRLISLPGEAPMLRALFEVLQADPEVPETGFRELEGDSFVVMGSDATRTAYAWAEARDGAIKGFVLFWPAGGSAGSDLTARDRAVSRLRASFIATPTRVMALPPAQAPRTEPAPEPVLWRRAGVAVSAEGAVLTAADGLDRCARITLGAGRAGRVMASDARLALLQPEEPAGAALPAMLLAAPVAPGTVVTLAGFGQGGDSVRATPVPARIEGQQGALLSLDASLLQGDGGGPVLTDTGALAGLVMPGTPPRAVATPVLREFLAQAGVLLADAAPQAAPLTALAQAQRAQLLTVAVTCWP